MDNFSDDEIRRMQDVVGDLLERYKEFIILNYQEHDGRVRYDESGEINAYTRQEQYEEEIVEFVKDLLREKIEEHDNNRRE